MADMVRETILIAGIVLGAVACTTAEPSGDSDTDGAETDNESDTNPVVACGDLLASDDVAACSPTGLDFQPGSANPRWAACAADDGAYHLVSDTPSSIARVEAYEELHAMLRGGGVPSTDVFTVARGMYAQEEGLESRLLRREDLHFASIPEEHWEPGVDGDKQCTVAANVEMFPQRCAGPALIAPIINDAFASGQLGEGKAVVHAARIDAALLWFLYLSVYKEANTCFSGKAKDCDSAWAYYTGGFDRSGGIGLASEILRLDPEAHAAIWDGVLAFSCLRELVPADEDPSVSDLVLEDQELLCGAQAQLDTALADGLAAVLGEAIAAQDQKIGDEAEANWAFVSVLVDALKDEAGLRDSAAAQTLVSAAAASSPSPAETEAAVAALESLFTCP